MHAGRGRTLYRSGPLEASGLLDAPTRAVRISSTSSSVVSRPPSRGGSLSFAASCARASCVFAASPAFAAPDLVASCAFAACACTVRKARVKIWKTLTRMS